MDDRRFDSLVRALAEGKSRRSVLKGLLGLGGAALVGSVALDGDSEAARRPTNPTPTPVKCPGIQTNVGGVCTCPATAPNKCGPDCCTGKTTDPFPRLPSHSECCDNACCFGTCYGEELCCPTNTRTGGLPPTHQLCAATNECCPAPSVCCVLDGCCDTVCYGGLQQDQLCCTPEDFCPGGDTSADLCCGAGTTCCGRGTNANACLDLSVPGTCCVEGDCGDPCQVCDQHTHTCGPRCDAATEVCCTEQAGPGVCQKGDCCPGAPCPGGGCQECGVDPATGIATCTDKCFPHICCTAGIPDPANWFCAAGECCPSGQGCDPGEVCCGTGADAACEPGPFCGCDSDRDCGTCETCNAGTCQPSTAGAPCTVAADLDDVADGVCCDDANGRLICVLADTCDCTQFCGPVGTGPNTGSFYCCTAPDYTICCDGLESECCGGPAGRQCDANGHCCEANAPFYCAASDACCAVACDDDDLCPEVSICTPEGGTCAAGTGPACCEGLSCCGGVCCASANCCDNGTVCCGLACDRCDAATDTCVADCRVGRCLCLEGQTCDQATGECVAACVSTGGACTIDLDCCSGFCINGLCADGCSPNGGACDGATDCCMGGTCISFGVCLVPPCLLVSYCNCIDPSVQNITCVADTDCCSGRCVSGACVLTPECLTDADCPPPPNECQVAVCVSGECGFDSVPVFTPTSTQTPGDCRINICDGAGGVFPFPDDTDAPPSQGQCFIGACSNGTPIQTPSNGAPCPVSNGTGTCQNGACVVATCTFPFADCDGDPSNGCETNTSNDRLNCGECGNVCSPTFECFESICD